MHDIESANRSVSAQQTSTESAVYIATTKPVVNDQRDDVVGTGKNRLGPEDSTSTQENQAPQNRNNGPDLAQDSRSSHTVNKHNPSNSETPNRVLSQDSSYQYDFYGRSAPARPNPSSPSSDGAQSPAGVENSSSDPEEGSKVSYRLSRNGYRIKNSSEPGAPAVESPHHEEHVENRFSVGQPDIQSQFSPQFENYREEEQESDDDDYQSSLDEFEQELAKLTKQSLHIGQEKKALNAPLEHAVMTQERELDPDALNNEQDAVSEEKLVKSRSFSPQGETRLKRDSISGSSVHSEKSPTQRTAQAVAHFATASLEAEATEIDPDMPVEEEFIESGQSRGAPDGMPTQRKVNTGDKPPVEAIIPNESYVVGNVEISQQKIDSVDEELRKSFSNYLELVQTRIDSENISKSSEKRIASPSNPVSTSKQSSKTVSGLQCHHQIIFNKLTPLIIPTYMNDCLQCPNQLLCRSDSFPIKLYQRFCKYLLSFLYP